tara:strand:- start:513 stop:647 length:135 start_codon:yes stop_codon:yes gene_type:complete
MIRKTNNKQRRKNDEKMDVTTGSSMLFRQLTQAGDARLFGETND